MRIGRVDHEGSPRAAIIDGETVRVLESGVSALDVVGVDAVERERLVGRVDAELPLARARLLAPVEPPTMRDFSVFEQHIEGVIKDSSPDATVPPVWYQSPFCYFTNPNAVTGPDEEIPVPPGCRRLDLELEVAAVIGRPGRNLTPGEAEAHIAGYTIFNDWSARDLQMAEMRLGLGMCKGKDFANTLGPWIVTPDELEGFVDGDRLDLEMRAEVNGSALGTDTLANMAWSFPSSSRTPPAGRGYGPGTCSGRGRAGAAACSSCGAGTARTFTRRSGPAMWSHCTSRGSGR